MNTDVTGRLNTQMPVPHVTIQIVAALNISSSVRWRVQSLAMLAEIAGVRMP